MVEATGAAEPYWADWKVVVLSEERGSADAV